MKEIHLLPLGNVDSRIVDGLRVPLNEIFRAEVEVKNGNIDVRQFYDDIRGQYNSTSILQNLHSDQSSDKVLAVLSGDLFIPILTYVFGEAELGGNAAVVSYHRLQNERYGLPPNPLLLMERLSKEAIHELGHAFGLVHCPSQACVMHASTYVDDIDIKGGDFCDTCRHELAEVR